MDERAKKMREDARVGVGTTHRTVGHFAAREERDTRRPGDNHTHEQRTFKKIAHRSRERPGYEWRIRRGEEEVVVVVQGVGWTFSPNRSAMS